jgi:hypothetical protein
MSTVSLQQLLLFKTLSRRNDPTAQMLSGLLIPISGDAQSFLEFVKIMFHDYTDHSVQHSLRILRELSSLLGPRTKQLSSVEIFTLIFATLFHDVGMVDDISLDKEHVREQHPLRSGECIREYFNSRLQILSEHPRLCDAISFVAVGHGVSLDELRSNSLFHKSQTIMGDNVRYDLLTILLRIGDLLDLDGDRACSVVMTLFAKYFKDKTSLVHHILYKVLTDYCCTDRELRVTICASTREQYQLWTQWLNWLEENILFANTYVCKDTSALFAIRGLQLNVAKTDGAHYEVWKLRFELDDAGRLWEVMSKSIYTTRLAFVRELILNAIDATLATTYNDESLTFQHSPRCWYTKGISPPDIVLIHSEKWLSIFDSGIGMNKAALEKFLFRVASCGHNSTSRKRAFEFPAIAEFGVGFISTLTRSEVIDILTFTGSESDVPHKVEVTSGSREALVETVTWHHKGTSIRLTLNFTLERNEVIRYIRSLFLFPSIPITVINLITLAELAKELTQLQIEVKLNLLLEKLVLSDQAKDAISQTKNELAEVTSSLKRLSRETDSRMQEIIRLRKEQEKLQGKYNVRDREYYEAGLRIIKYNADFISQTSYKKKIHEILSLVDDCMTIEGSQLFSTQVPESPFVCLFSAKNTEQFNVKMKPSRKDIHGDASIIWVPINVTNYDDGIEWQSIHGLLCHHGMIVDTIVAVGSEISGFWRYFDWNSFEEFQADNEASEREFDNIIMDNIEDADYDNIQDRRFFRSQGLVSEVISMTSRRLISRRRERNYQYDYLQMWEAGEFSDKSSDNAAFITAYRNLKEDVLCQDGLKLPVNASEIVPVGICYARANMTANARLRLNVTREDIDRSQVRLSDWVIRVAYPLNVNIIGQITAVLEKLGIDYDKRKLAVTENGLIGSIVKAWL